MLDFPHFVLLNGDEPVDEVEDEVELATIDTDYDPLEDF